MHVVIAEPQYFGHYYTYVRRVLEAVREVTSDITLLVSPQGLKSQEFAVHLAPALRGEQVIDSMQMPRSGLLRGSLDMIRSVRQSVRSTRADHLLLPSADYVAQAVGMASLAFYCPFPRSLHAEGLLTNLSFVYPGAKRKVPHQLIIAGLQRSPWTRLHVIDLLAYQWLKNNVPHLAQRFSLIPDPVEAFEPLSKPVARRALGLPEDGRLLVCPGILIRRKGIDLLLEAFLSARSAPTDRVLLAGPLGADVSAILQDPRYASLVREDKILVIDKCLNVEELGKVLCAGDITACPYPQQWHPSSIAIKSLACQRPVLGADSFWLGRMIPAFEMGWTVPVHDPTTFGATLQRALTDATHWKISDAAQELVAFQSVDNFKSAWKVGLQDRLGRSVDHDDSSIERLVRSVGLSNFGSRVSK